MPGSRRYFGYFDDAARELYVELDESNGESTDLGFAQSITATVFNDYRNHIAATSKRPIQMRYILAQRLDADDRVVKRKFFVGATSAAVWGATANTASISGQTWNITAKVGEVRILPPARDTGLIDGDVETHATPIT